MTVHPHPSVDDLVAAGLELPAARALHPRIVYCLSRPDPAGAWTALCDQVLRPSQPFELHRLLFGAAAAGWSGQRGPFPAWHPSPSDVQGSNLAPLLADRPYEELQRWSFDEPEGYWPQVLRGLGIRWSTPPERMLDVSSGPERARWMPGAVLNAAASCFEGRELDRVALLWQAEQGPLRSMTLRELRLRASRVAAALEAAGLRAGEAVAVDMPMTAESVEIYLGIVLAGCVVVSIADSFAAPEIATRLHISKARAIFTQDRILRGGRELPLYDRVVEARAPRAIVLPAAGELDRPLRAGDLSWGSFLALAPGEPPCEARPGPAESVTNILFSSGTTGEPKAIPWTQLTPIKAAADGWAHHDIRRGDVVAWPTNLGWMMGPWLIYASLLNDAAIALYEGVPSGRGFCRFVQRAGVTMLGVVPSLVRAWRDGGCTEGLDWTHIRRFSSTGEPSNGDEMLWLMSRAGYRPVIEYCGGTEIGGGYITGSMVQPQAPATFSTPAMGCRFVILDDRGRPAENGELALFAPMLGSSNRLLNRDHHQVYFAGMPAGPGGAVLRRHGDHVAHLGGGFHRALGRVDDTMNLGGIKVSSAELERACAGVPGVIETAAIAVPPPGGGPERLVIFAVADPAGQADPEALRSSFQRSIRQRLNPLFKVAEVRVVSALPRTASNKVMRRVLRDELASAPPPAPGPDAGGG